jgi:hypothetical protein
MKRGKYRGLPRNVNEKQNEEEMDQWWWEGKRKDNCGTISAWWFQMNWTFTDYFWLFIPSSVWEHLSRTLPANIVWKWEIKPLLQFKPLHTALQNCSPTSCMWKSDFAILPESRCEWMNTHKSSATVHHFNENFHNSLFRCLCWILKPQLLLGNGWTGDMY